MAKPRKFRNGPDTPEWPGEGADKTGGKGEEMETGGEEGEGKESATDGTPTSPTEQPVDEGTAISIKR